jgi:hypothetical protein
MGGGGGWLGFSGGEDLGWDLRGWVIEFGVPVHGFSDRAVRDIFLSALLEIFVDHHVVVAASDVLVDAADR